MTMKQTMMRIGNHIASINPSPLLRQVPTLAPCIIAAVLVVSSPVVRITDLSAVIGSGIGILVGIVLAWMLTLRVSWRRYVMIIPIVDVIAICFLQYGTDGFDSVFAAAASVPLLWFTAEAGRRHLVLSITGAVLSLYAAYLLFNGRSELANSVEFARDRFTFAVICTVAGVVVFALMREGRRRMDSIELMLAESRAHAAVLSKSEARASAAEGLLRGLWEAITEQSAIGTDESGLIDAWNPGAVKMLGISERAAVGKRHIDEFHLPAELVKRGTELDTLVGSNAANPGFEALIEAARLGITDVREWTYLRGDGSPVPVELSVTARLDSTGETVGYLFVAHDLTKAREVSRLKDEFVGLISHELRTPLSSILGYLELMRDDQDDDADEVPLSENKLGYLDVAERNAYRLLRLVGDLLFTAQVESGTFHLTEESQQLVPILAASVDSARPAADAAGIDIRLESTEDFIVNADAVRLGQACDNLISNAIKFTPRGGTVTVSLGGSATRAVITVADTGMGIAADELDQLFSRFFRTTTATRNAVPGVGLGLVITRAIARAHGGDMSVTSEEGVGTTFSMTLPVLEPATV
jgi:signal transduction histidine kinase